MGASGALHAKERFLFSCLSECVRVSLYEKQLNLCVPGGATVQEPPIRTGPSFTDLTPSLAWFSARIPTPFSPAALSTLRAWSRKPMKSRELRTVTVDESVDLKEKVKSVNWRVWDYYLPATVRAGTRRPMCGVWCGCAVGPADERWCGQESFVDRRHVWHHGRRRGWMKPKTEGPRRTHNSEGLTASAERWRAERIQSNPVLA